MQSGACIMPKDFIIYLDNYMHIPDRQVEESASHAEDNASDEMKEVNSQATSASTQSDAEKELKERIAHVTQSKAVIEEAKVQGFSKVGRILNEFPFRFTIPTDDDASNLTEYFAFDAALMEKWVIDCFNIITKVDFEIDIVEIPLQKKTGTVYGNVTECKISDAPSGEKLNRILDEIILKACADVLDESGQLKPRLIELLNLKPLMDLYVGQPNKIRGIVLEVLYSYCSQIVIANMITPLQAQAAAKLDLDAQMDFGSKILQLQRFLTATIQTHYISKNKDDEEIIAYHFTDHFRNKIRDHIDIHFQNALFSEKCASELERLPPERVNTLVHADIHHAMQLHNAARANKIKSADRHTPLPIHKIHFWIDVMDSYHQQYMKTSNRKYYFLLQAIALNLTSLIHHLPTESPYTEKYINCFDTLKKSHVNNNNEDRNNNSSASSNTPSTSDAEKNITNLLNADENLFIFENILAVARSNTLSKADKELVITIKKLASDTDFIQQSPSMALGMFHQMATATGATVIADISEKFIDAIIKTNPGSTKDMTKHSSLIEDAKKILEIQLPELLQGKPQYVDLLNQAKDLSKKLDTDIIDVNDAVNKILFSVYLESYKTNLTKKLFSLNSSVQDSVAQWLENILIKRCPGITSAIPNKKISASKTNHILTYAGDKYGDLTNETLAQLAEIKYLAAAGGLSAEKNKELKAKFVNTGKLLGRLGKSGHEACSYFFTEKPDEYVSRSAIEKSYDAHVAAAAKLKLNM
jgi:hypothetical protein